jgi:hypothetical protein
VSIFRWRNASTDIETLQANCVPTFFSAFPVIFLRQSMDSMPEDRFGHKVTAKNCLWGCGLGGLWLCGGKGLPTDEAAQI